MRRTNGFKEIEVTREAEDKWIELLLTGVGRMIGAPDCTPGYYNNEGREPGPAARLNVGHPAGAMAYFKYIDAGAARASSKGCSFADAPSRTLFRTSVSTAPREPTRMTSRQIA